MMWSRRRHCPSRKPHLRVPTGQKRVAGERFQLQTWATNLFQLSLNLYLVPASTRSTRKLSILL